MYILFTVKNHFSKRNIWTRLSNIELTPSWQVNDYEVSFDANNGIVDIDKKTFNFSLDSI